MKIETGGNIDVLRQVQKAAQAFPVKDGENSPNEPNGVKRDEYIPSEKDEPIGLYNMEYDENGDPKINFDDPNKSDKAAEPDKPDEADEPESEKSESEECICDTDKVDREIKQLKEKAERLEQQLRSASGKEAEKLQKQLAAAQSELAQKDNDSYRRSQAVFS